MAFARWQRSIVDASGAVVPQAWVEVRGETPGAPLVSLYADREGATPLSNPFQAGSDGFAAFHCIGGAYRITATKGALARQWRYEGIGLASETDVAPALVPRGEWASDAVYAIGHFVNHEGFTFASLEDENEDNEPTIDGGEPVTDAHWMALQIGAVPDTIVVSDDVTAIVKLTQAEYDALDPPDSATFYLIIEED